MSKTQISETVQEILATALPGEIESPGFLITITDLNCASDFSLARVSVSILPEKFSGTALKNLRKKSKILSEIIKKKLKLVKGPFLVWEIDDGFKKASSIEASLDRIKQGD